MATTTHPPQTRTHGTSAAASGRSVTEYSLRDGTRVLIRPIRPEDKRMLVDGLERMSATSRYRRFLAPIKRLTESQLRYFTEIDYVDHMAWCAIDPEDTEHPGLGVARYIRYEHDLSTAEVAVAVVDSHQGRGLGTLLLGLVMRTAAENGIATLRSIIPGSDAPMLKLLAELGAHTRSIDAGVIELDIPIPKAFDQLADTIAGRVLKAIARGEVDVGQIEVADGGGDSRGQR